MTDPSRQVGDYDITDEAAGQLRGISDRWATDRDARPLPLADKRHIAELLHAVESRGERAHEALDLAAELEQLYETEVAGPRRRRYARQTWESSRTSLFKFTVGASVVFGFFVTMGIASAAERLFGGGPGALLWMLVAGLGLSAGIGATGFYLVTGPVDRHPDEPTPLQRLLDRDRDRDEDEDEDEDEDGMTASERAIAEAIRRTTPDKS